MKDQITKNEEKKSKNGLPNMALTFKREHKAKYLILVLQVRANWLREKRREEKRRREEKKKKKKKKKRKEEEIKVWNLLGTFVWILYGFLV